MLKSKDKNLVKVAEQRKDSSLIVQPTRFIEGLIKSEVNLERLPFFTPSRVKRKTALEKVNFVRTTVRDGVEFTVRWQVRPHNEYGLPNAFDRDVYRAIQEIINRKGIIYGNLVPFSYREICRIMGIGYSAGKKGTLNEIKESLRRIRATEIESTGAFRLKGDDNREGSDDHWINDVFSIFGRIIESGHTLPDGSKAETNFLELGSWYVESITRGYLKRIDLKFYRSLAMPLAKFLYSYLDVVFFPVVQNKGACFKKRYSELCQELLIRPQAYRSKVLQILRPAIQELKDTKYLAKFELEDIEGEKGDWYCIFYPGDGYINPHRYNPDQIQIDFSEEKKGGGQVDMQECLQVDKGASGQVDKQTKETSSYKIVQYFHNKCGHSKRLPKQSELDKAEQLIDQYGEMRSRMIIDFAAREAKVTNYEMKFFGAILHFINEYQVHLEDYFSEQEAKKKQSKALREAQATKVRYGEFIDNQLSAFQQKIGEKGWGKLIAEGKKQILEEQPQLNKKDFEFILDDLARQRAKEQAIKSQSLISWPEFASKEGVALDLIHKLEKELFKDTEATPHK